MASWIRSAICLAIVALMVHGCNARRQQQTTSLDDARSQYEAGRYVAARRSAEGAMRDASVRPPAAYIAALSAFQLGDLESAERFALVARESSDERTSARANAMLGLVWLEWRHDRDAADAFAKAHRGLIGTDARRAAEHAAIAYERLGDTISAEHWLRVASTTSAHSPTGASNEFALQIGAFKDLRRARNAARDAEPIAEQHGLAPVRIVSRLNNSGDLMHVVQIGMFPSRSAANRARQSIGRLDLIVAPAVTSS